jgi:hypothetical protein
MYTLLRNRKENVVDIDREEYEDGREAWLDEQADAMIDYAQDDEETLKDLDDVVDRMMTDPVFYDRVVGWF